jgi:hypothetical protein
VITNLCSDKSKMCRGYLFIKPGFEAGRLEPLSQDSTQDQPHTQGFSAYCSSEVSAEAGYEVDSGTSMEISIYHLFTETEGNSVFCGPETAVGGRGATKHTAFPGSQ